MIMATPTIDEMRLATAAPLPPIERITSDDLGALQAQLSRHARADGYSASAGYYAMTGRKGLWRYGGAESFCLIAAHPNRDGHLLIFPPMGEGRADLLKAVLDDPRISAPRQLARFGPEDDLLLTWARAAGKAEIVVEEVLDWKYPVHTLSTERLLSPVGGDLRDYRKNLARAERREAGYRLANNAGDLAVIADLSAIWARAHGEALSADDPTAAVLSMIGARRAPVHALILEEHGTPQGYMIWEETDPGRRHANSLGGVSMGGKGLSEFGYRAMAEVLDQRGFKTVCIGGSETESLDAFKRKLAPARSTPLVSAIC